MLTRRKFTQALGLLGGSIAPFKTVFAAQADAEEKLAFDVPAGSCDCHVHVIGPQETFPMDPGRTYTAPTSDVERLRQHLASSQMSRVVLVQPSFYGFDNRCMLDALSKLGPMSRGVAVIRPDTLKGDVARLAHQGVRGVRLNLEAAEMKNTDAARKALKTIADLVAPFGWHIQMFTTLSTIEALRLELRSLPVPVVFDHFAKAKPAEMSQGGFSVLLSLLEAGKAYVKCSALYRVSRDAPNYEEMAPITNAFLAANDNQVIWGSDFPHTGHLRGHPSTDISPLIEVNDTHALNVLSQNIKNRNLLSKVLVDNPARLYGF